MTSAVLATPLVGTVAGRVARHARTAAVVAGFALLTAAFAQIEIPLGFTPVPLTGQTFAVLVAGAALGARLGASSQALYVALGAVGFPFFSGGDGGWEAATGVTAGYLAGFVVAAAAVGRLAERRCDCRVATAIGAFAIGTVIVYAFGVPWLAVSLGVSLPAALELGLAPFVAGDLIKIVVAGLALPAIWRLRGAADR